MPDLCRNWRELGTTWDNRPEAQGQQPQRRRGLVLSALPLSAELRILSRKGCGFDSRRSHSGIVEWLRRPPARLLPSACSAKTSSYLSAF
jgi:hypothetical protein